MGTRVAKRGAQGWMLAHRPATRRRGLPRTAVVDHGGGAGGEKSTSRGRSAIKKIFLMHNLATQIGSSKRGGLDEQAIRHCIEVHTAVLGIHSDCDYVQLALIVKPPGPLCTPRGRRSRAARGDAVRFILMSKWRLTFSASKIGQNPNISMT